MITMATTTNAKAPDTRPAMHTDGKTERPDLSRCEYTTDKGRRCRLAVHTDDTQHVMVFRTGVATPKTLAELRAADAKAFAGFSLAAEKVPTTEDFTREYTREAEPRDADQIKVDGDAKKNYQAWVAKGSPAKSFEELGKMGLLSRYIFPPAAFDTIVLMLRRATQTGGPVNGKKLSYRRKAHVSGNAMIYFVVTDKSVGDSNGS
jgi:hypothetical protein